ncbi:MAG TPA: alpha/beta hydrolase [Anaerolineales bacterium]
MNSIPLENRRTLGYAEYGDLRGIPVFFFHGTPGSRFFRPSDEITSRLGVHLICVDRPGYGLSTFQPGRSIMDWPKDIIRLADSLGLDKFAVAGHSGGGPYTLACAYALPERVRAAALISATGPIETPEITHGMSITNKFGLKVGRFIPWSLWQVLVWFIYHRRATDPAADIERTTGHRPQADEEQIRKPEVREACIQSEIEAFRSGLQGLAWDTRLLTRPWGFLLEDIRPPVHLWSGSVDDLATVEMARFMSDKIHGCKITFCENEAHLLLFSHWEEILTNLLLE